MKKNIRVTGIVALVGIGIIVGINVGVLSLKFITEKDNIITKHIETRTYTGISGDLITIEADIVFLWSDSDTYRIDRSDEILCMGVKFRKAVNIAGRKSEHDAKGLFDNIEKFCSEIIKEFIDKESGEADWVFVNITSAELTLPDNRKIQTDLNIWVDNPYYVKNWYFETKVFSNLENRVFPGE